MPRVGSNADEAVVAFEVLNLLWVEERSKHLGCSYHGMIEVGGGATLSGLSNRCSCHRGGLWGCSRLGLFYRRFCYIHGPISGWKHRGLCDASILKDDHVEKLTIGLELFGQVVSNRLQRSVENDLSPSVLKHVRRRAEGKKRISRCPRLGERPLPEGVLPKLLQCYSFRVRQVDRLEDCRRFVLSNQTDVSVERGDEPLH